VHALEYQHPLILLTKKFQIGMPHFFDYFIGRLQMNGSRRTFMKVCFIIGGFIMVKASSNLRLHKFTPVRTVTMVADIWIQVFEVPMPDIPVRHDDIQCGDSKGLSAGSLLLRSYKCTGRKIKHFQVSRVIGRRSMILVSKGKNDSVIYHSIAEKR